MEISYLGSGVFMTHLNLNAKQVDDVCRKYRVATISVFGSMARNEATKASDIDLLVSFSRPVSLLQIVTLLRELSEALGREVDLLTEAFLSPYLRDRILKDRRLVYAA
jgi:predicted nucleotidyltransferase